MLEAAVVLDLKYQPIYWHLPATRTSTFLQDDRTLWEVLLNNKQNISGVAHSHPGSGRPTPSGTDISTFSAIERGLGIYPDWWITSQDCLLLCRYASIQESYVYVKSLDHCYAIDNGWLIDLRRLSY